MLEGLYLSLAQLPERPMAKILAKSLLLTLALFVLFGVGLWHLVHWLADRWFGAADEAYADIATLLLLIATGWLLFRAIAVAVIGFFAEEVVAAVEAKHYPDALQSARNVSFVRSLHMGLGSIGRLIVVNILLSPIYLALLITGIGTAAAFFLVNSWLLGRDLGDMVAARHVARPNMADWRRRTTISRFALGMAGTGMFLLPILNLVAPILGAAMATHAFHKGKHK